jgi:hypothetical protein
MRPLDLGLAVLAAGGDLGSIDQCLLVQVEPSRSQSKTVPAQTVVLETLLGHGRITPSVDILRLHRRNVPAISRHGGVLRLERVLDGMRGTLEWKWA